MPWRALVRGLIALSPVLVAACGGHSAPSERQQIASYIDALNKIEARAAPALAKANTAYKDFADGKLQGGPALAALASAQDVIDRARADIAKQRPPARARELRRRVLRVYDLNAELAQETTQLAVYLPAARRLLARRSGIDRRLRRRLLAARTPATQAAALTAYRRALGQIATRMRALLVPPILQPTHADQLRRLGVARALAGRLRQAALARDSARVAALLARFGRVGKATASSRELDRAGIRAYLARYRLIGGAVANVRRAEQQLRGALE